MGFLFESIQLFSKSKYSIFTSVKHKDRVNLHWILNTLGLICILLAYASIYLKKEQNNKNHLTSWHGLISFIAIVYTLIQYVAGHNLTVFNNMFKKLTGISYGVLAILHATSGTFLFGLICASFLTGFYTDWYLKNIHYVVWYLSFAYAALFAAFIGRQFISKYFNKLINLVIRK